MPYAMLIALGAVLQGLDSGAGLRDNCVVHLDSQYVGSCFLPHTLTRLTIASCISDCCVEALCYIQRQIVGRTAVVDRGLPVLRHLRWSDHRVPYTHYWYVTTHTLSTTSLTAFQRTSGPIIMRALGT